MAFDKKTFFTRAGSAIIFVMVLTGSLFFSPITFFVFFGIVSVIGIHEFMNIQEKMGTASNRILTHLLNILLLFYSITLIHPFSKFNFIPLLILILVFLGLVKELFEKKENAFLSSAAGFMALLYVTGPVFLIFQLGFLHKSSVHGLFEPKIIFGIILFIWSNDTFAYLVGSFFGKHKLLERISPGKTIEGSVGGGLITVLTSPLVFSWFGVLSIEKWLVISILVVVFGTLGDLVESMLKRNAGIKDSGNIMPGHGGVLDRFDSLIFSVPFVYFYLFLFPS